MVNTLNMRLSQEDAERLNNLAKKTDRSKSFYIRKLIHEYLDDLEDVYLSEKALEEVKAGKERLYTPNEIRADILGS